MKMLTEYSDIVIDLTGTYYIKHSNKDENGMLDRTVKKVVDSFSKRRMRSAMIQLL